MIGQRAATEPYVTRFETEVTAIDGRRVWLESSYFYGERGGQPADHGAIGGVDVTDVRFEAGEPVHSLAEEPSFKVGHRVLCSIDWSFRMYCMRAHTASHVLYGAARRLLENLDYAGIDIDERRVRIDLETSTTIDDEILLELDERVSRVVWESRRVSWDDVPAAEARNREEVAFSEAIDEDALANGRVRLVTIRGENDTGSGSRPGFGNGATVTVSGGNGSQEPWDVTACGGTHVRNTREIGPVTVLGCSTRDDGVTGIELAVGPAAIERRTIEKRITLDASRILETPVADVPDELQRSLE
ncbi:alanyl-tRNA editing protein [Natrarchaeobaculum sulfurireducens]|nr:alanyl-tRNA editing protein [Natrarchaeobaculum sulfurireducens]AXR76986.1 Alanyl-tRNA synthetase [Natrarchaeobaculum sulfurireducens]